jgi:cytochrome oxidase Cu insertion factor (SCO1/SenC/PrrC family)
MNARSLLIAGMVLAGAGVVVGLMGRGLTGSGHIGGSEPAGSDAGAALRPDPGWENVRFPEFALVDQDGEPVDQSVLDGRVTAVDFIFTSCPLQCPAMTGAMWQLSEDLKGTPVRFLSMSIDPAHDTPERLREYAAGYGVDTGRWLFLTGDKDVVRGIVRESLMYDVSDNPESQITLADGSTMQNIVHPPHFILVGPQRQVLGTFYFQDPAQVSRLRERAAKIAATLH